MVGADGPALREVEQDRQQLDFTEKYEEEGKVRRVHQPDAVLCECTKSSITQKLPIMEKNTEMNTILITWYCLSMAFAYFLVKAVMPQNTTNTMKKAMDMNNIPC
jgi:hypothetical protein